MKVYVVLKDYHEEGYSEPLCVFDSKDKAEDYIKEYHPRECLEIFELEVL